MKNDRKVKVSHQIKMKLSKETEELIQSGTMLSNEYGKMYYFLPFWFEKVGDKTYIPHSLGSLPKELKDLIYEFRE